MADTPKDSKPRTAGVEASITDIDKNIDQTHADVVDDLSHLWDLRNKSKTLDVPQDERSINRTFHILVTRLRRSAKERASQDKESLDFEMYVDDDLKRPSIKYRDYERIHPYGIRTTEEVSKIVHSMAFRRLQGKMQLFPLHESPLLRTRLTHTLEVADIANRICMSLNQRYFKKTSQRIDPSIVTAAALAHDLGHPPFGHTGELALARFMHGHGSFEGNAQTLRILTRLENRFIQNGPQSPTKVRKNPLGLNLLFRTLASVVKYDNMIGNRDGFIPDESGNPTEKLKKGFYESDGPVVQEIKKHVVRQKKAVSECELKTVECQIMDLADDIAYSIYDFEDCMIANVTHPLDLISSPKGIARKIASRTTDSLANFGYNCCLFEDDITITYLNLFRRLIIFNSSSNYNMKSGIDMAQYISFTYANSHRLANDPERRRSLAEAFISAAIEAITIEPSSAEPALTKIHLDPEYLLQIEALKHYNYLNNIMSERLQIYASRANMIIRTLCERLYVDTDNLMLSKPQRDHYDRNVRGQASEDILRRRFICDLIASMTDDEAIRMYGRVATSNVMSVFGML